MERLTKRNSVGVAIYKTPYDCGNCNETLYRLPDYGNGSPTDKLADYEDAEENGLLIHLPCRVGDTVYVKLASYCELAYGEATVRDFSHYMSCGFCVVVTSRHFDKQSIPFTEFGKTVFLTEAEAEQALKMGE